MTFSLTNPGRMPPHGWKFFQAQTQWGIKNPKIIDFAGAVLAIKNMRLGNPQYNLSTDSAEIGQELMNFTAARLNYDSAWVIPSDDEARAFVNGGSLPEIPPAPKRCKTCG